MTGADLVAGAEAARQAWYPTHIELTANGFVVCATHRGFSMRRWVTWAQLRDFGAESLTGAVLSANGALNTFFERRSDVREG